jgi:general secretion pathway protein A
MRHFVSALALVCLVLFVPALAEPSAQDQQYEKATLQYLTGDLAGAAANLRAILKVDPRFPGAAELLNSILREQGLKAVPVPGPVTAPAPAAPPPETPRPAPLETGANAERLSLLIGLGGAALAAIVVLSATRRLRPSKAKPGRRCFSCGAEISLNIDHCQNCGAWIGAKMQLSISKAQKNWYKRMGWRSNPFTLDFHPELFTGFKEEVKLILEKVSAQSGHILITAPLGAGKTTLLRWLSNQLVVDCLTVYIPRPPQEFTQLIKLIVEKMGVPQHQAVAYDIYHLTDLRKRVGKPLIILMDEAHEFTLEIEKPLRTLGDLDDVKLIMAGLPETAEKFHAEIRPLYERLVLNINLKPIDLAAAKELIAARIEHFGGERTTPFTDEALQTVYEVSGGIPRRVIKACDWAVTRAIEKGEHLITGQMVEDLKRQTDKIDRP